MREAVWRLPGPINNVWCEVVKEGPRAIVRIWCENSDLMLAESYGSPATALLRAEALRAILEKVNRIYTNS